MTLNPQRLSGEEVLAAARVPATRLMIELSQPPDSEFLDPERAKQVLFWTRSSGKDDPSFRDEHAVKADLRHLGFFDDDGQLIDSVVAVGRKFLDQHWRDTPNYPRFWRHMNAHLGHVRPEPSTGDYSTYSAKIAELLDENADNIALCSAVMSMERDRINVPTKALCQADRIRLLRKMLPASAHETMCATVNQQVMDWFAPDGVAYALRQLLKNQSYGLGEEEFDAWLEDQGQPGLVRQLAVVFGQRNKAQTLRDLGLLDKDGHWSEVGFQREQALIQEAIKVGREPSLEWLRWELHHRHRPDAPIPFAWALDNDALIDPAVHRARRLASVALSGGILGNKVTVGDTITPAQYQHLRQLGSWLHNPPDYERQTGLWYLGFIASQKNIKWDNWTQICSFVWDKLDRPGDRELLIDWLDGVVTFEGRGRHQANPAAPFKGTKKVGRNDPCPCGSGRKYKKCCGR